MTGTKIKGLENYSMSRVISALIVCLQLKVRPLFINRCIHAVLNVSSIISIICCLQIKSNDSTSKILCSTIIIYMSYRSCQYGNITFKIQRTIKSFHNKQIDINFELIKNSKKNFKSSSVLLTLLSRL